MGRSTPRRRPTSIPDSPTTPERNDLNRISIPQPTRVDWDTRRLAIRVLQQPGLFAAMRDHSIPASPLVSTEEDLISQYIDFILLGSISDNGDNDHHNVYDINPENASLDYFYPWYPEPPRVQSYIAMAWDGTFLYRVYKENGIATKFEKIEIDTDTVTAVPFVTDGEHNWETFIGNPYGFTYLGDGTFLLSTEDAKLFHITDSGDVTIVSETLDFPLSGLAVVDGTIFALRGSYPELYTLDSETFAINVESLVSLTSTDELNIIQGTSLAYFNSTLYGILRVDMNTMGDVYKFYSIEFSGEDAGVCTPNNRVPYRAMSEAVVESVPTLVANITTARNLVNYGIYKILTDGGINSFILTNGLIDEDPWAELIAYNPDDNCLYRVYQRDLHYVDFEFEDSVVYLEKINLETLERTSINFSGIEYQAGYSLTTSEYINDGGGDMYDSGNVITTDVSDENDEVGPVVYTHTRGSAEGGEGFTTSSDGEVVDGSNWFGAESTYFTNMYPGLFVLMAKNINIDSFAINGELGADGGGAILSGIVNLGFGYKGYYKKVYDAGDPSVNHLIIVPPNSNDITHTVGSSTDNDYDVISGLDGITSISYLLFAKSSGGEVTEEEFTNIGNLFLQTAGTGSLAEALSALNIAYSGLTDLIPDVYHFTDYVGEPEVIRLGYSEGVQEPCAFAYRGDGVFVLIDEDGSLYHMTDTGVVTRITNNEDLTVISGITFVGDRCFAILRYSDILCELDVDTGLFLDRIDKKGKPILLDDGDFTSDGYLCITSNGEALYLIALVSGRDHQVYLIKLDNLDLDEDGRYHATTIEYTDWFVGLTLVGFDKKAIGGRWFWNYNDQTQIEVPKRDDLVLDISLMEAQYNEDSSAIAGSSGWEPLTIVEIIEAGDYYHVIVDIPSSSILIRMRFVEPESKWTYYQED
jgi:hypothetical protein